MDTPTEGPKGQPPRHLEFEDPHFHDDVDFEPASEGKEQDRTRPRKPARKLPPPRRRFED